MKRLVAVMFVVLPLILLAAVIIRSNRQHRQIKLPDGSTLRIDQVVYATAYRYNHYQGTPFHRILENLIPPQWQIRLGFRSARGGGFIFGATGITNLFLMTSQRGVGATNAITLERLQAVDQDGSTFEAVSDAITAREPNAVIQGWKFKAFPRRTRQVRCRFIYKDGEGNYRSAGEVELSNPAPGPHPVWTPDSLPVTRRDSDVSATLTDFVAGSTRDPKESSYWAGRALTRATFRLEQAGHPHPSWKVQSVIISDATGNTWKPSLEEDSPDLRASGDLGAEFIGALWPSEPAWKLRVEFSRTNDFEADELWASPNIPVPAANSVLNLNSRYEVSGIQLNVVAIGGVGAEFADPFGSVAFGGAVNLAMRAEASQQGKRVTLVKVVDDAGRPVPFSEPYPWHEADRCFALQVPQPAKTLLFTFAIHRSKFMDFVVKPRQMTR